MKQDKKDKKIAELEQKISSLQTDVELLKIAYKSHLEDIERLKKQPINEEVGKVSLNLVEKKLCRLIVSIELR